MTGIPLQLSCGYLTVPEDRTAAAGREIRLLVIRVRPQVEPSPDPVIALGFDIPWTTNYPGMAPMAARVHRELIMLAMRGSGRSEPSLVCTEIEELGDSRPALGDDPAMVVDLAPRDAFMGAVQACHDRLVGDGVNLAAYNLVESAADVEDLRVALGIDAYNLATLGTTSRVAFEVMRRHPEHLRSVFMDTPSVPQVDMFSEAILGTRASLAALSAACEADLNRCGEAYPDLEGAMATAMTRLADEPIHVTGFLHPLLLDDVLVLRWLRTGLASGDFRTMPDWIQRFADGDIRDESRPATWIGFWPILSHGYAEGAPDDVSPGSYSGDWSHGLQYSIACHDQLPFVGREALIEATAEEPWFRRAFLDSPFVEICERWDVGTGDGSAMEPVVSSVPTLLLVGQFDPFGVPQFVRTAAESLEASWVVEFPSHSHNVLGSGQDCPLEVRNAWIDAPTEAPDTSCIDEIPPVVFPLS